jgi:hypothetical protein
LLERHWNHQDRISSSSVEVFSPATNTWATLSAAMTMRVLDAAAVTGSNSN